MIQALSPRTVGRPTDPTLASRILDAGWAMFLERGVEAVSVEAIAARAGVAKATFYKHFADKAVLFEAAMLRETERIEAAQNPPVDPRTPPNLQVSLRQFGIGLMNFMVSPPAVDFYKALSAELARHKSLAQRFYDLGPGRTKSNLAALLRSAAQSGELDIADPLAAAEQLIGLWQGISNFQLALDIESSVVRASIPQRVDAGLRVFFAAYELKRPQPNKYGRKQLP